LSASSPLSVGVAAQKPAPVKGPLATAVALALHVLVIRRDRMEGRRADLGRSIPRTSRFRLSPSISRKKTARIVFGQASAAASAFLTSTGLNVIETTALGNFLMTTVFVAGRRGNTLQAVHSRHLGDLACTRHRLSALRHV
jgi:hypothetical protein